METNKLIEKLISLKVLTPGDYSNVSETKLIALLEKSGKVPIFEIDVESIENNWDYARLFSNLLELVTPEIDVTRIRSKLDREHRVSRISFVLKGKKLEWKFTQISDFVSDEFIDAISELISTESSGELVLLQKGDPYLYVFYLPDSGFV